MKHKHQILTLLLLIGSFSGYGRSNGIYKSYSDYKNDKLTYESGCTKGKTKIRVHDFFWNMPTIKVVYDGQKYAYKKVDLYGYKDCKNEVYRFYNNTEYRIAEAGNIYIYVQQNNVPEGKGYKLVNTYYFSTAPDNEIMPLTYYNLRTAYHSNDQFLDLLDQFFSNGDVSKYDDLHKTFKVNYVYSKTVNNK